MNKHKKTETESQIQRTNRQVPEEGALEGGE